MFRTRGKQINPQDCNIVYNGNEIGMPVDPDLIHPVERVHNEGEIKNFKLLGVLFDEYLSFDEHINGLCAKISKSLFCINRIKNFVNQDTLKTLYFAMVHSHLVYCINIYSCANTTNMNKLRIKQKQAIRTICNAGFREHTAPLFTQLRILPIDQLIKLCILKFMHSFQHNVLPLSFRETWITKRARNPNRELRNASDLYIPSHNFATLKRLPLFNFPSIWNTIGMEKNNPRQHLFIKQQRNMLLLNLQ